MSFTLGIDDYIRVDWLHPARVKVTGENGYYGYNIKSIDVESRAHIGMLVPMDSIVKVMEDYMLCDLYDGYYVYQTG